MAQYGIGLSALNAFSEAIDVTSNNIANGQTVGYKSGEYIFSDQFFKAQNPQARDRAGMGTSRMIIRRANTYGTISGTQNPLDLAIAGPGMFMLAKQVDGTVPTENPQKFQYTRNGQFVVDNQNRIVNENGLFLVGYAADASGSILESTKSVLKLDNTPLAQQATKKSTIEINIDSRASIITGGVFDPKNPSSYSQTTSQTVYDDRGKSHTLSMYYKKVNSADLILTQDPIANTFKFQPKQAIGTTLNGEQNNTIATTAAPGTVTGLEQTLNNTVLTYVSGGSENITGIKSVTIGSAGSGYVPGIYKNVPLITGGAGTGALATVTIAADGTLGSVQITNTGSGYATTNTLSISEQAIGGTGSGISLANIVDGNLVGGTAAATFIPVDGYNPRTESNIVTFSALAAGQTLTLGGLTLTATVGGAGISANNVAAAFASAADGTRPANPAEGSFSGTLTGYSTGAATGAAVTFTSNTALSKTDGYAARTESNVVTFSALAAGKTLIIGGLTLTAGGAEISANNVAAAFASAANGTKPADPAGGTFSGTLTGYSTGAATGSAVTFTSSTANTNITDLANTGNGTVTIVKTEGGTRTETTDVTFSNLIAGDSITVGGLTLTASGVISAANVATAFANAANGTKPANPTNGTFSGAMNGFFTGAVTNSPTLTFTSTTESANVTDLTFTTNTNITDLANTGTGTVSIVKTEGGGKTESSAATFRDLVTGDSLTIGGLTLTATGAITAANVANAFRNISNGGTGNVVSNGTWSGTLSGWSTGAVNINGTGVTFTSSIANSNITDLSVATSKVGTNTLGATYNLKLTDGTNLSIKQLSPNGTALPQYKVEVDRFAIYATLDGVAVGQTSVGTGSTSIKISGAPATEQTTLGTMAFVGGKNIDSLARDQFGKPQFITQVAIDASGGAGSTWGKTDNGGTVQFTLDSTNMTGYSSVAQTYANTQDGSATSQLTSYSFDAYGKLVAQYDNGKSVTKGQLILATFNNFEGLIPVGGNGFQASSASGDPLIDKPNGSQMGAIRSQSVEESNVDLTQQLVKLMVLQRAYSAASQATKVQVATLVDDTLRIGQ